MVAGGLVERLLAAGAPIKESRALDMTAYALYLLDHGADINEIGAFRFCIVERHGAALPSHLLHSAVQRSSVVSRVEAVRFLIDRGENTQLK